MNFKNTLPVLAATLLLIFISCSSEDLSSNENGESSLILETDTIRAGGPDRVSFTGNQDFAVQARKHQNGTVSGFWRDKQTGIRVNVECISFFNDQLGSNAVLSGTVQRGPQAGINFVVRLVDGQTDGVSARIPVNQTCESFNPQYLFPMPISSGNVKIN